MSKKDYSVIRTKLDKDYCDVDLRMIHACFTLLCEFVDNEHPWENMDMTNKSQLKFKNKVMELYNWWNKEFPTLEEKYNYDVRFDEECEKQLIKLMKLRMSLWT